jgi:hypothetical protein
MNKIPLSKYVGKEYEKYNCLDLVKEFYMDHYGIKVRDYFDGNTPSPEEVECLIVSNKGEFIPVSLPEFGDIVTISLKGIECHIGVCIDSKQFLHSVSSSGSCVAQLSRYKNIITGFHRHRDNKND